MLQVFIRLVLIVCGALFPLAILYSLSSSQGRRRIAIFLCLVFIFFLLKDRISLPKFQFRSINLDMPLSAGNPDQLPFKDPAPIPDPPWWIVLPVSLGLSALGLTAFYLIWRRLRPRHRSIELVAEEARKTIDELGSGVDLKTGVIRCYHQMNRIVKKEKGLSRNKAMTVREFEHYLGQMGLSDAPIERLTRLFEKVRYGSKNLGPSEEREAVDCLTAIIQACEETS